jgi:hypothetical protein
MSSTVAGIFDQSREAHAQVFCTAVTNDAGLTIGFQRLRNSTSVGMTWSGASSISQ